MYYGIHLDNGSDNIIIQYSIINGAGISGIQLYDSDDTNDSTDLTITNNIIYDCFWYGISILDNADTVTVTNNTIYDCSDNAGATEIWNIYKIRTW